MAAVIRLKRRVDEDPLNAFVLNCKRQRTESSEIPDTSVVSGETSTVLKFAGTFAKADNISSHLQQRLSKEEAKEAISRVHRPTIASRNRAATRQNAQNNRFRIVNCTRSLNQVDGVEETTIVDVERDSIEPEITSTLLPSSTDANNEEGSHKPLAHEELNYVYDLYVAEDSQHHAHIPYIPENLEDISVAIYDDPLYSSHRDICESDDESEDSNDENNWRNDYPDEDDDVFGDADSVDEDDMRRAVQNLDIEGEYELSSDDEDFVGGGDSSGFAYPPDDDNEDGDADEYRDEDEMHVNPTDVTRFGTAYAKYKARIMKQMKTNTDEYDSEIGSSDASSQLSSESENFDLYD
ncbi:probable RNA polymerase II nuclear localization protein SLC7A6OS [Malaya genurostris]|uniref:probable RNA polymerase II nuclear localization protein SLC7A6OS n=1 Tax=Malaya genurostris TaxID=325434 RepID=UPI0026F3EC48|nr:probable RNA polymerase II nuclear localization protein SLC7A6OS [Malaya genurostris]